MSGLHRLRLSAGRLLAALPALLASAAGAETVGLVAAPESAIQTTVNVMSAFGNDSDGPVTQAVTGSAEASFDTAVDGAHGLVATSLQFTASDLGFEDAAFSLVVLIPIDISIEGARATFDTVPLAPGIPVAPGAAELDLTPLALEYTEGETVVLDPPGIPLAGTFLDLSGTAEVETTQGPAGIDVRITVPIDDTTTTTDSGVTVEVVMTGAIVLEGTVPATPVPALSGASLAALGTVLLALGLARRPRPV